MKELEQQLKRKEQTLENLQEQLKHKEQECEKLKTQYNCYACGTCKGKEDYRNMARHCENAIKANHRYKQSLDEIEKYLDAQQQYFDGEDYHNLLDIINKVKEQ